MKIYMKGNELFILKAGKPSLQEEQEVLDTVWQRDSWNVDVR